MKTSLSLFPQVIGAAVLLLSVSAFAETTIIESAGTISSFSPDSIVISSQTASAPTQYVIGKEVTYVDDSGAPVAMEVVRSGVPVTVHYVREGERVVAQRVVVHRSTSTVVEKPAVVVKKAAPVIEERTVVKPAPAPVVEEHTVTTTTTTAPSK